MPTPPRWNSAELLLADVALIGGFKVQGVTVQDYAGFNFGWGDFNGDGLSDLIICSDGFDGGGLLAGGAFVIYGKSEGVDSFIDLSSLSPEDGFVIQGELSYDLASRCISGAGDVNGDGIDDLFIGAFKNDEGGHDAGAAYIIYGRTDGFGSVIDLYDLDLSVGVKLVGEEAEDYASFWVASAGDVNGDGRNDLIMGAPQNGNVTHGGAAYVIYGRDSDFTGKIDLGALDPSMGFKITGVAATDLTGYGVSSAGDINNDGFADLIVGAPQNDSNGANAGLTFVIYGRTDIGAIDLATLTPTQGFAIRGEAAGDYAGYNVFAAGDVNADGFDDIIVGAPYNDAGGANAGAAYVVFGQAGAFAPIVDLATLDGTNGFKIQGEDFGDEAGACVATAGDVNGDGYGDLLVGSWMSSISGTISGAAYILFGGSSFAPVLNLAGLDAHDGLRIRGESAGDITGRAVSAAGDMNGDGYDDLAVGSPWNAVAGAEAGAAYVIYGRPTNLAPTGADTTQTILEDSVVVLTAADLGFSDADGDDLLSVTISSAAVGGKLMLDADGSGPGLATEVLVGETIGAADIAAGRLTFVTTANLHGLASASFGFQVQDDGGVAARGADLDTTANVLTFNLTSVNDLPVISGLHGDSLTFVEGDGAHHLDVGGDAAVSDADSPDFDGGTLRVEITANLAAGEDELALDTSGSVTISGTTVLVGGIAVGSVAGGASGNPLVISLNADATPARISTLLEALTYRNTNTFVPALGQREITVSLNDGDGLGNGVAIVHVDITSTFDAAQAVNDLLDTNEASAVSGNLFANNGGGVDLLGDSAALSIVAVNGQAVNVGTAITLASGALLTVQADGSFSYDPNHAFDATPAAVSGASNSPALDSFTYQLDGGSTATATVRVAGLDTNDDMNGTAGNDVLTADLGTDRLYGLAGNDTYILNNGAHQVFELAGEGTDTVRTTVSYSLAAGSHVDALEAFDAASTAFLILRGNEFANTIRGNAGINSIAGGGGANTLIGFGGDDSYVVDSSADVVVEVAGGGNDTVYALGTYVLAAAASVETLLVYERTTTNALDLTGNGFANTIHGNAGANVINGGGGTDFLIGNGGNDTFIVDSLDDFVVELGGEGNDIVLTSVTYALPEGMEIEAFRVLDALTTNAVNLTGNKVPNLITGNAGNNVIDGKGGGDQMYGLAGDDVYVIRKATDQVFETAGQGYDTVRTLLDYSIAASAAVEELRAYDPLATTPLALTGNGLANTIVGNAGANSINGGLGADLLSGLGGNDSYLVDNGGDQVVESAAQGTDVVYTKVSYALTAGSEIEAFSVYDRTTTNTLLLYGNAVNQTIYGNNGSNLLSSGGGADTLYGMGGDDAYLIDGVGDAIVEFVGGGYDVVYTTGSFELGAASAVELITVEERSTTNAVNLFGNGFGQAIYGNAGNNLITGGGGADVMYGFAGDDAYVVDSADDKVFELAGQGTDTVYAAASFTLDRLAEVELLTALDQASTTMLNLGGSAFGQTIYGNNGINFINGGGGVDMLYGFGGNDAYLVDGLTDRVFEAVGSGNDTVYTTGHFALGAGSEVEVLSVYDRTTTKLINLLGNEFSNTIYGNAGNNVIDGKGGADTIFLMGGTDKVYFSAALGGGNVDAVAGFASGDDKLQLDAVTFALAPGALSADAFVLGNTALDADDRLLYAQASGQLWFDADGSGAGAAILFATLGAGTLLNASDFLVV